MVFKGMGVMYNFWSIFKPYQAFRQSVTLAALVLSCFAYGQVKGKVKQNRAPANYIPDDEVIITPVANELSFYQQYVATDMSQDVVQSRNQLKVWNDNQVYAEQYGMDASLTGSQFYVPTQEEKLEYFKNKYMRYLRNKGEQPLRDIPQNWYQSLTASNEVDTIDEMENKFKSQNGLQSKSKVPESLQVKEVSLWDKTKFIFQPRVEQGLIVVGIKSPIAYARAWIGVNGRTEMNIQQTYKKTGTRFMMNYYADTGRYFTSIDQKIIDNLHARVTSQKNPDAQEGAAQEDNTVMLLYAKQF